MKRESITSLYRLTEEERQEMLGNIEAFYLDVRDEEIGIIAREQLLDFFLETLGAQIYNKALDDVHGWYKRMHENLESDFYALYK